MSEVKDILFHTNRIRHIAIDNGADLIGFADLKFLKGIFTSPRDLLDNYKCGISVAVSIIPFAPYTNDTEDKAFDLLERVATEITRYIRKYGFNTYIIPPDKRISMKPPGYWLASVSHKAIAKTAGLGWIGKSSLLVTPNFGPRVCLITILTDMSLEYGVPMKNKCGACNLCIESCPVNAIKYCEFEDHPNSINDILDVEKCGEWIDITWDKGTICFKCISSCPIGIR